MMNTPMTHKRVQYLVREGAFRLWFNRMSLDEDTGEVSCMTKGVSSIPRIIVVLFLATKGMINTDDADDPLKKICV